MELYNKENASPTILNSFAEELKQGIEQGIERGIEQGMEKGMLKERHAIAQKLISQNMSLEIIAEITEITVEEVKEIQKMMN